MEEDASSFASVIGHHRDGIFCDLARGARRDSAQQACDADGLLWLLIIHKHELLSATCNSRGAGEGEGRWAGSLRCDRRAGRGDWSPVPQAYIYVRQDNPPAFCPVLRIDKVVNRAVWMCA